VHPDVLSYLATGVSLGTAFCYVRAADRPWLLLAAIGLILLRMTLNTLDGVIAIRRGSLSLKGEIVNALPDRFSDVFLIGGIALSPLCGTAWGLLGLSAMLLVSYTGVLGRALGVEWQHHGPLGKVERLVMVMAFSLAQFFALRAGWRAWTVLGVSLTPLDCCMLAFTVLGPVTVYRRTRGMLRQIARLEWRRDGGCRPARGGVLVAYDSVTGNTEKVAGAIADSLGADLRRVEDIADAGGYKLVVIGSPTLGGRPSRKVLGFLRANPALPDCAAFVTYGAPVWGPISARRAFACFASAAGKAPVATFACKGRHAKIHTYSSHPNEDDLLSAFLFGISLARKHLREPWTTRNSPNRSSG
jgi:phosphatidylglycerophosphate synthase